MILAQKIQIYMDLGRSGTTPYIFTFRCFILTWFFRFGKRLCGLTYLCGLYYL